MLDSRCPHRDDLAAFSVGLLSDGRSEQIGQHLEHCGHCTDVLEGLPGAGDELWALLRSPAPVDGYEREAECQQALADLIRAQRQGGPAVSDVEPVLASTRQYRLVAKLGAGGMGAVFKVVHTRLERVMALKVLLPGRGRQAEAVARFEREIRLVGQLDHPHIVRPTDAGEENGVLFLVMEYVDGVDVSALLEQGGPLPVAEACEIVRQAALGLQHAHERGIVHRDVKPSNLMVDRQGTVKILDFGVAYLRGDADDPAPAGRYVMGTLDYMAPEQGDEARAVDHRADLYSLGATLYKLLSGAAPLVGGGHRSIVKKLWALAAEEIQPIRQRRAEVPEGLAAVLERMLAKDPERRYAYAAEVAAALAPWATGSALQPLVTHAKRAPAGTDTIAAKDHQTYCGSLSFVEPPSHASGSRLGLRPDQSSSGLRPEQVGTESQPTSAPEPAFNRAVLPPWRRQRIGWRLVLASGVLAAAVGGIVIYLRGPHGQTVSDSPAEGVKIVAEGSGPPPATPWASWPPAPPDGAARWQLGPDSGILTGILPRPARLPGIRRWQVRFAAPTDALAPSFSGKVRGVRFSPDGQVLAMSSGQGELHLLSPDGQVRHRQVGAHTRGVQLLAWSADGRRLAVGDDRLRQTRAGLGLPTARRARAARPRRLHRFRHLGSRQRPTRLG
ncbi:MAG: serine/threonine-protein kinase [Planctomycetota bacterium]|nr:serine/threonine-protein kinase [Planctomycetota bacterium]